MRLKFNSIFNTILIGLGFFFMTGCVTLYKPNIVHSPLLKDKGDFSTSGSLGLSGNGLFNSQTAYAVSNHVGILLNGMYHYRVVTSYDSTRETVNIWSVEPGVGYFSKFGADNSGLFQFYGGFGNGTSKDQIHYKHQEDPIAKAKYYNIFIQPGIAYTSKYFEAAFDIRANYVKLYDIHAYLYSDFDWWNTDYIYTDNSSLSFMNLEPTITLRRGSENFKGVLQIGAIIPTINRYSYFDVNSSSIFLVPLIKFSIGLNYTFGKKMSQPK